ncbi:YceG family protein [Fusobacterium sp.]|uniref:YceG family protein n=1 Tax=Fusobacterium sp. TaxID=68766 RepID=UPI0029036E8F|nr:YceG family protein [Fusobacterium sp.]MDU1910280.1 YceG family protein [Fusobacterium sp.]
MVEKIKFNNTDDFFKKYSERSPKGIYFYRVTSYSIKIEDFLFKYLEQVKICGVYIKNNIQNPTQERINYFIEMTGKNFIMDKVFMEKTMKKWIPQLSEIQITIIIEALFEELKILEKEGKNINILKNTYVKYMCWFYYRFQSVLKALGKDNVPKILFDGNASNHELKMLNILAKAGCDIILLQTGEDINLDRNSALSYIIPNDNPQPFPKDFSITALEIKKYNEPNEKKQIKIVQPQGIMSTNTWITAGYIFEDSLKSSNMRGNKDNYYYNMFVKMTGVEDKNNFMNELFKWKLKLSSSEREVLIIEGGIHNPDGLEVQQIKKKLYQNSIELINELSNNISFKQNSELELLLKKAFAEIMTENKDERLQKLSNSGVILLCWINRYISVLFKKIDLKKYPVFIYYGSCRNENEKLFIRLLARIPVDVIIFCPDKTLECNISDKLLFEETNQFSIPLGKFPKKLENINFGTTAYNAERDLDSLLYQDSGLFRQNQFKNAIPITLQTTYEEIGILWNQEAKYRQNFEILSDRVMVPVICSKICGVPNKDKNSYWKIIEQFLQPEGIFIKNLPFISEKNKKTLGQSVVSFIKNKKIQVEVIKKHPSYNYKFIRDEMQNYIFEKAQQLLDSGIIPGTFSNGIEFTILNTILNLDIEILRLIQKYDFTKKIPKLVIVDTTEQMGSKEDGIITAFLKFLGFDILLFVPTGYQSVDGHFEKNIFVKHQIGEYVYDMKIPIYDKEKKKFDIKKERFGLRSLLNLMN